MCAPISAEQMAAWKAERARKLGMDKITNAQLFGTANVIKIDVGFESRSYEQRFLRMVEARRAREKVRV